ncbi:MAG: DsrE family protein [Nitrospinae bacterium]|nr:DsrE family protein [Nitrospinota bacterium]
MSEPSLLIILSGEPYAGSDRTWNGLRLAETALGAGAVVRIFLINEGVDAGRPAIVRPENSFDLGAMLTDLVGKGAEVRYCKTCIDRCGVGAGEMAPALLVGSMKGLYQWIAGSDRVVTF